MGQPLKRFSLRGLSAWVFGFPGPGSSLGCVCFFSIMINHWGFFISSFVLLALRVPVAPFFGLHFLRRVLA